MKNSIKDIHCSGTLKLIYKSRMLKKATYSSRTQRAAIMATWHQQMKPKHYYVVNNPDWFLWNGEN